MATISIRGTSLFVDIVGHGYPVVIMHGGPGADHTTMRPLRACADHFTLIFYDHRCNGRSDGGPVTSMTWDNLTADADALRQMLGFDRWAVIGHSFGGMVALEYALRYPEQLSHLVLLDTGGDIRWSQEHGPQVLAERGFPPATVETARRLLNGQIAPNEMLPSLLKLGSAYNPHTSLSQAMRELVSGPLPKLRPEALIYGATELVKGWTVMARLAEIQTPTLVMAGRDDFQFPPEHQVELAAGIPDARLKIIERAGHNPQSERPAEVIEAIKSFILGPGTPPAISVAESSPYEAIDAYVEREMRRLKIPGLSLAIVERDQIVHLRGFGRARPGGERPTPRTPFFIGSLNKSVIALSVMQLVEAGKIELDAPVQRYLPWFRVADPRASAEITVRHLLNQTSGLPTSAGEIPLADFDAGPAAAERQARALETVVLMRPVGSDFAYSNANYHLLALVIEAASGQSCAAYLQERIFAPLGMSHTYTSHAAAKQNGLALGHRYWFGFPFAAPDLPLPHGMLRTSLIISGTEDMARYLIALLNGGRYGDRQLLSSAGIDELQCGAVDFGAGGLGRIERLVAKGVSFGQYGMGWDIDQIGQTRVVSHGGTMPDFGAFMALVPEQKKGLVLLFNANHHWMVPVLAEFEMGAAALLAGEQPVPTPAVRLIPWALRGQLLIPVLQAAGVAATLRRLRRWRLEPERRPPRGRARGRHLLLPLIPNLLVGFSLRPMLGKRRGYLKLYMPDFSWTAMICGGFALAWSLMRTALVLGALRKPSSPLSSVRQPSPRRRRFKPWDPGSRVRVTHIARSG